MTLPRVSSSICRRERAQILPLFALSLFALVCIVGVVVDGSTLYVQRRTAQNAADAAALAGSQAMIQATSPNTSIGVAICTFIRTNAFGSRPQATATFVDTTGTAIAGGGINLFNANCDSGTPNTTSIPSTAAGVNVEADIPYNTYLLDILGISTVTADASATSRVATTPLTSADGGSAPFIVCGIGTWLYSGGTTDVLQTSGGVAVTPYALNNAAINQVFTIHSSHVDDCGKGSSFKGLADTSANAAVSTLPADFTTLSGTRAGPTRTQVNGINGCSPNNYNNCVMLLPIATGVNGSQLHCVLWAAFQVTQVSANTHSGKLIGGYSVQSIPSGSRSFGWTFGSGSGTTSVTVAAPGITL